MSFQTTTHLITRLLALSFLTTTIFMVQGRQLFSKATHAAMKINEEKVVVKMRSLIGSKPPKCDERCNSCGHCEAVQVPILPLKKFTVQEAKNFPFHATPAKVEYSRGDDISNYKPMCWKCKCGDFLFNPW